MQSNEFNNVSFKIFKRLIFMQIFYSGKKKCIKNEQEFALCVYYKLLSTYVFVINKEIVLLAI